MAADEKVVTAYHEAGHAVLGWMFDIHVVSVTIDPFEHGEGTTIFRYLPQFENAVMSNDAAALKRIALVGLGGMAADAMHHRRAGRTDRYMTGDAGDQFRVREHIHRAGYRSPSDFEAFLMTASQMIDDERIWSIVRGLAERLLTNIAITEEELATFRATVPSTTDVIWKHLDTVVDFMRQQAVQKGTSL